MTTTIQATLFKDSWPPLTGRDQRGYRISDCALVSRIDRETIIGFRLDEAAGACCSMTTVT